jgi:TPR repeat protein
VIYQEGEDIRQDMEKAKLYYKRACDLRRGTGCYNLAVLFHVGKGTKKNCREAGKYYRLACRYGFVAACSETCN